MQQKKNRKALLDANFTTPPPNNLLAWSVNYITCAIMVDTARSETKQLTITNLNKVNRFAAYVRLGLEGQLQKFIFIKSRLKI